MDKLYFIPFLILLIDARYTTAQLDISILRKCANLTAATECSVGSARDVANVYYECNERITGEQVYRYYCSQNEQNLYCGTAYYYLNEARNTAAACATSATNCTDDCRSRLMYLRNQLGCCLNLFFNNSLGLANFGQTFSYSLWRGCDIEPRLVDQMCSAQPEVIPPGRDETCTNPEARLPPIICTRAYIDALNGALSRESDCEGFEQVHLEQCGINANGDTCLDNPSLYAFGSRSLNTCTDSSVCDPDCLQNLQRLNDSAGCCINNFINTTFNRYIGLTFNYLSYDFWDMCNLTTPGVCQPSLTDSSIGVISFDIISVVLVTISSMVFFI